jgi:hypothetical protein
MAEQTNVQQTSCGLRGFERNRYFAGKQLYVRDFIDEQTYFNGKRYLLNRLVHSWGVVCGLRVEAEAGGRFKLGPGAAIDCCGREIVVGDEDLSYSLDDLEGSQSLNAGQTFYICLKYDECIREPVQAVANVSSCTDVCDYNRIREGFKLFVTDREPTKEMDFCGLATESHVLATGTTRSLKVERVVPRWVNPKEVFEVRVVVTADRQEGGDPINLTVEERFPAGSGGGFMLAQGPNRLTFSLGPTSTRDEKSYMARAGASAGKPGISCDFSAVSGAGTLTEVNKNSVVEVVEGSVEDLLVQTFFEEELEVCPSCADDHCLYLAKAVLGALGEVTDVISFPSKQYVYNNQLLYDLLSCGGQRVGKIPEVPALGQSDETVVSAVNSMKFFDGVKVAKTGDGRADISANVDEGLTVAGGKILTRRGDGITLDANQLATKLGQGLAFETTTRAITIKDGAGLGFETADDSLKVKTGQGVTIRDDTVVANFGDGLDVQNNQLVANLGNGLDVQGRKIVVKVGDGLTFGTPDPQTARQPVVANVGGGLRISGGAIVPIYSRGPEGGKVCESNDPRLSDAREAKPHKERHQKAGSDQISVSGLLGLLEEPQKVSVQSNGRATVSETCLNFTGEGVSVQDEPSANRVNINIGGGAGAKVSTGEVTFTNVQAGEQRFLPVRHGLGSNDVAIVLCYIHSVKFLQGTPFLARVFGSPSNSLTGPSTPLILAVDPVELIPEAPDLFIIYLADQRLTLLSAAAPAPVSHQVRWWAIASTESVPHVGNIEPGKDLAAPVVDTLINLSLSASPGATAAQVASSTGIPVENVTNRMREMSNTNLLRFEGDRFFIKEPDH